MAEDERPKLYPVPEPGAENVATAADYALGPSSGVPGLTHPSTSGGSSRFLTDMLVELGFAKAERVQEAVDEARTAGRTPEQILLEKGDINPDQLARATAERFGLDHVDLSLFHVDMGAVNMLPSRAAKRYNAIPVGYADEQTLILAMADPANVLAVDDIQMMTGYDARVAVAARDDIEGLINRMNTLESAVTEAVSEDEAEEDGLADVTDLRESAEDAPVIKLVNSVLGQAVSEGASDVHFEPEESQMRVRFRIDGVLHDATSVPKRMVAGVVSRIKIMSDMDIAEKRIPQDGRIGLTVESKPIDLRVTTLPGVKGEGAVLRILDKSNILIDLDKLGIGGEARRRFENAFRKPHGAVFVTGPTGSGKSTSLYAALNALNDVEKNIITIEDPVEYQLPGINQIQVNNKAGLTFAAGLRSMLRADPDIIMVGEIRDSETALIAIESALTGHLVLSTLHTNNAPTAIARLTEMGIEPFLTASALDCVLAQRLARTLCPSCKRRTVVTARSLTESGFRVGTDIEAYEAVGCGRCKQTGYKGRLGLYEVMPVTDELKALTIQRASGEEMMKVAREQGMATLREDGLEKIRQGMTTVEEVTRVSS